MKKKIKGTYNRPRLYVFKSNQHIYAQILDDINNTILVSSSSLSPIIRPYIDSSLNCKTAAMVGKDIAIKSKEIGINKVVFDRGKNRYHGRIKALADSARQQGINF